MSGGKRSFNISLGGSSAVGSKPNPFARTTRQPSAKAALGFQDDDDNDASSSGSGPPKRKLVKLDHDLDDNDGLENASDDGDSGASSKPASANVLSPPPPLLRKPARDDDEDEDAFSRLESRKGPTNDSAKADQANKADDDEEDDPLDAFMAGIDSQVQQEAEKPSEERVRRDDIEDEDYVESYMKHMKKKGITIGQGGPVMERDEDADSDEEVYATARAIDNANEALHDLEDVDPHAKKEIMPLPRMDHSKQDYVEIEKCFYEEHEDIARLSDEQVRQIRMELDMRVSGADFAKPCISFAHFGFEEALMETIRRAGYSEPSGIQRQAIPVALSGRDIIGIAKTGSGKTAAFLLPMIVHIMDQQELDDGDGPIGVVLAPTRELADQIYSEAKRFAKAYSLRVAVIYGGANKRDQFKTLRAGVEIVVATPGRLIDMIKMKATNFRRTSYLVLDEADRVFDLGFEPQVRSICDNIRPDRQTLLFSATFQKRVERLAREVMSDPVRISIGNVGQINSDVTQVIQILKDDTLKWDWLMGRLQEFESTGSVLIFVSRKNGVVELTENLKKAGVKCECLHGDMLQQERDKAVHDYKARQFPTLIATDVAARGLDIKSVRTVVNYDVARDIDSHVHRVGRTGRAGEKGTAFTLITEKDDRFAGDLVRNLEESDQPVSPELMKIAMQNPRFRKSRQFMSGNRGGRGRGRGGRGGHGGRGGRGGRGGGGGSGGRFHSSDHFQEHGYSTSSNNTPLGQNDRRQQGYQGGSGGGRDFGSSTSSHGSGAGYRVSGFHKATRPETGSADSQPPSSTGATAPGVPPQRTQSANQDHRPPPSNIPPHAQPHPGRPPAPTGYGYPPPPFPHPPPPGHPPGHPSGHPGPPPPGFPYAPPPPGFPFPPPPPGAFNGQHPPPHPPPPMPPHLYRPPPPAGHPPHGQHGNQGSSSNQHGARESSDRRRRWDH
ncbi:P-loop containing nucleoside triphosphate hydrolase protein [Mortierella sp. GBAus27b]|nr:P-loop containing nucleoside triphosphate hydrolase protein [Mortierella sp. GBAus27b]